MITLLIIFSIITVNYSVFAYFITRGIKKSKDIKWCVAHDEFISVIIPFRNESENILQSLESIKIQDYPKENYEVIYVDDKSEDNSVEKIVNADKPCNVKVISVPPDYYSDAGKIRAINFGIEDSKGEIIVITDCDCTYQRKWLSSMLKYLDQKTGFIAGPVGFISEKSLFNKIQKLEFAGLVLAGAGLIGIKKPVICNSANLAFRREAFICAGGFKIDSKSFSSADEYLMINIKNKTSYNVKFCWDKDSVVYTRACNSIGEFFNQRKRWASKEFHQYGSGIFIQLILVYLFFACFFIQLILGIVFSPVFFYTLLLSLAIKFYSEYNILNYGRRMFYDKINIRIFLLAEILHIPYILITGLSGIFGGFNWKNRKYNN